jgi:signal transduction histidine kinase
MAARIDLRRAIARWWLLLTMVAAIGLVLATSVWSAAEERQGSIDDFSHRQALLATAVGADFEDRLSHRDPTHDEIVRELLSGARALEKPRELLVLVARPNAAGFVTSDNRVIPSTRLRAALDSGAATVVIPRDEAVAFGLPRRTAVAGLARVASREGGPWGVVVLATAERLRDRQIHEQWRLALTVLVVAGVAIALGTVERRRQRSELQREREAALAKAEKMAALAALSSGIAHELGTPLGVIVGRVEQVQDRSDDQRTKAALDTVLEQVERMRGIVRAFLALARGEAPLLVKTKPEEVAVRAASLVQHRFDKAGVELECAIDGDVPPMACDPALFEQALVNVLLNACEATPRGGHVRLSVRREDDRVHFIVDDDGPGIPDDVAKRATEPFFSTRLGEGGSGLGLTIAREIVNHHAGNITLVRREGGAGTRATITIAT